MYALNFAFNNADAINDDFIVFEDEIEVFADDIKKYKRRMNNEKL